MKSSGHQSRLSFWIVFFAIVLSLSLGCFLVQNHHELFLPRQIVCFNPCALIATKAREETVACKTENQTAKK
jgi:uncharacterized membrane protein YbhN (UPF0104 family)